MMRRRKYFTPQDSGNIITGEFREPVSSNVYANGSNQNGGNVITDKRITRVHAPPGGRQTFSIATMMASDEQSSLPLNCAPTKAHAVSSNVFANGANQNSGNFLTDKPTTRVRAPPGGVSTLRLI
jgi:hypothetical protein